MIFSYRTVETEIISLDKYLDLEIKFALDLRDSTMCTIRDLLLMKAQKNEKKSWTTERRIIEKIGLIPSIVKLSRHKVYFESSDDAMAMMNIEKEWDTFLAFFHFLSGHKKSWVIDPTGIRWPRNSTHRCPNPRISVMTNSNVIKIIDRWNNFLVHIEKIQWQDDGIVLNHEIQVKEKESYSISISRQMRVWTFFGRDRALLVWIIALPF